MTYGKSFSYGIFYDFLLLVLAVGLGVQISAFSSNLLLFGVLNIILLICGLIYVGLVFFDREIPWLLGLYFLVMLVDVIAIYLQGVDSFTLSIVLGIVALTGIITSFHTK